MRQHRSVLIFFSVPEEGDHLKGLKLDTKSSIRTVFLEIGGEVMHWIYFSKNTTKWRAVVNKVMNLEFNKMRGCVVSS
jgi:hypothetical protein